MDDDNQRRSAAEAFLSQLKSQVRAFASEIEKDNCDVHDQRLYDYTSFPDHQDEPCCAYFYYMRFDPKYGLEVRQYFYPEGHPDDKTNPTPINKWSPIHNKEKDLIILVSDLAENARADGKKYLKIGDGFDSIVWRRKSYVIFFMDNDNWEFHKVKTTKQPALTFLTGRKKDKKGTPNHSFFDGLDLDIPMNQGKPCSAFVCVNHMKKDKEGKNLEKGDNELYHFLLYFNVTFAKRAEPLTIIFDPDGNNLGPPLPPPY